jgi:hypothetical protein
MKVTPKYSPVGSFFQLKPAFKVPLYQRSYSWEQSEIEDFLKDLAICYDKRKYADPMVHFFGQIVCIEANWQGTYDLKYLELVDGQQRIATFTLLVLAIINIYKEIINEMLDDGDSVNHKSILNSRIGELTERFIQFPQEVGDGIEKVHVLELSKRDKSFFKVFFLDTTITANAESHKRIKDAYNRIHLKIKELTTSGVRKDYIGNLKMVEQILDLDFCVLNMITGDRKAAYKLFQVLNNRGKNLTEGDLLRSESLRILEPYGAEQEIVEHAWDSILVDAPVTTELFLRAIYGSHTGIKASTNSLFDEFLTAFIPQFGNEAIDAADATAIQLKIQGIESDFETLRQIRHGLWPYAQTPPVEHWDRHRLFLLIHALGHLDCLPFLLSAKLCSHVEFSKMIQVIERFVFRYLLICNQYAGDLITLYHVEAKKLRNDPAAYTSETLKAALQPLMAKADDTTFRRHLEELVFHRSGISNKPLKYFLLSLEYFYRWNADGAIGTPTCNDKERSYDFNDSTIEHVYPQNARDTVYDATMEALKNTLGNLTILGHHDNRSADNDGFLAKKGVFISSSLKMNSEEIAGKAAWTKEVIEQRTEEMKIVACKIFKL